MVVSSFHSLVSPEVDHIILVLDELEAERLVPSNREYIEGDLSANRKPQVQFSELTFELLNKCCAHSMLLIVLIESLALLLGAVPANWTHIDHAISELNERSSEVIIQHVRADGR